eukprot:c19729_g1_i2 orf=578-1873(+)
MPFVLPAVPVLLCRTIILVSVVVATEGTRPLSRGTIFDSGQFSNETVQQVHISLAGPNYIRVSWITSSSFALSIVEYGEKPGIYDNMATGSSESYSYILYKSGLIHNVVIGPFAANKVYFYRCGGDGSEYSFKTPPEGPEVPVKLTIVGDLGQTKWTQSTLDHIQQMDYDVLILPGDLSYADYYQPLWDSFGKLVEPLAVSRPWMVTEGNHEMEEIPFLISPFRSYNARWQMPYIESGSDSNLYYSFEVAGAHVVMLGSYADYSWDSSQWQWLQDDLAKLDRHKTPWLIVVVHAPWYHSNAEHRNDGDGMMKALESLLQKAKVDVLFAGHVHAYERTNRIFQGKPDPCGIIHITVGDGGNREGLARRFVDPKPEWSLFREASFGHGLLQVMNSTHAQWTWHRNQDNENVVTDAMWLNSLTDPLNFCMASTG